MTPVPSQRVSLKDRLSFRARLHLHVPYLVYVAPGPPLIVYSMTKSGSSSIHESIKAYTRAIKVHTMNLDIINEHLSHRRSIGQWHWDMELLDRRGYQLYHHLVKPGRRARYITTVRNPVDRGVSRFFQSPEEVVPIDDNGRIAMPMEDLLPFATRAIENDDLLQMDWFEAEYRQVLGVDVYDYPFPHETGYLRIQLPHADILLLKVETSDDVKNAAIQEFLGIPEFHLKRTNVGSDKGLGEQYKHIKQNIQLSSDFVNGLLASRLTRHFYSEAEIAASRDKWLRRAQAQPGIAGA